MTTDPTRRLLLALICSATVALASANPSRADGGGGDDGGGDSGGGDSGGGSDDGGDDDGGGDGGGGSGSSGSTSNRGNDGDRARDAVRSGKARPLSDLIKRLNRDHPGKVIDVDLRRGLIRYVYDVKILAAGGKVVKVRYNALTLEQLN